MSSEELTYQNIWQTLSSVDCNEHTDKKGNLTYLSWAWAWGILMEHYPSATFEFADNETHADDSMTVHCTVTIGECQRSMWLPVMDYKNAAIKSPNARDISDNKMRCLTKTLALMGLGHYIYSGEDTVNAGSNAQTVKAQSKKPVAKPNPKAKPKASEKPTPEQSKTSASINGKEWPLEERMEEQKKQVSEVSEETIKNVMYFIFQTIFYFSLPPEGSPEKEGDPETVAGWIGRFTSRSDNNKALLDLHKAGYKEEVSELNKELDKLRSLSIEQLRDLIKEQQEK